MQDEADYGSSLVAKLLSNGDVAVLRTSIRGGTSMMTQYRGAMHSFSPRCVNTVVPGDGNERTANVMLHVYVNSLKKSVDTVICDEEGKMWINSEEEDGHSTSFEYLVVLEKPDDGGGGVAKQAISDRMRHNSDKVDLVTCVFHLMRTLHCLTEARGVLH